MRSFSMRSKTRSKTETINADRHRAIDQVSNALDQARTVLVLSHIEPDGDAIGTQLAFGRYLEDTDKQVFLARENMVPEKYRFLHGAGSIPHVDDLVGHCMVDTAVVLECPTTERIGRAKQLLTDDVTVVNIDHHPGNRLKADVSWLEPDLSSVGEMAYEYFVSVGYRIDPVVAEYLYTAIVTDTGQFRFSSTSPRTMQIAGALIAAGADSKKIVDLVYHSLRPEAMKLLGRVLNGIEYFDHGRVCMLTLTRQMLVDTGSHESDSEGFVDFTLFSCGVECGALLKEIDARTTKASLRSRDGINVAEVAARFGGGGHYNAAGCTIPMPLAEARHELLRLLGTREDG